MTDTLETSMNGAEDLTVQRGHVYRSRFVEWSDGNLPASVRLARFNQHAEELPLGVAASILADAYTEHARREAHPVGTAPRDRDAIARAKLRELVVGRRQAAQQIAQLRQQLEQERNDHIPASDPRLQHIWIQAARWAQKEDYCGQYEAVASHVGAPSREELRDQGLLTMSYSVAVSVTFRASMSVEADSAEEAVNMVDGFGRGELSEQIGDYLAGQGGFDSDDIDSWNARSAELDD